VTTLSGKVNIVSDLQAAKKAQARLMDKIIALGYGEGPAFAIKLALEEGINNAIKHGNGFDASKSVEIAYNMSHQEVAITITDQGCGFDPGAVPDPTTDENLEKPCGRGIMLMRAYMDEVRFNEQGNQVFLLKRNIPDTCGISEDTS